MNVVSPFDGAVTPFSPTTFTLTGHPDGINCLAWYKQQIVSGDKSGHVFLWDLNKAQQAPATANLSNWKHPGEILSIAWFRPTIVVATTSQSTVHLYDIESGKQIAQHNRHTGPVNTVVVANSELQPVAASAASSSSSSPALYFTAGDDGYIYGWDQRWSEPVHTIKTPYPITSLAVNRKGTKLYSGGIDHSIHAFDLRGDGTHLFTLNGHSKSISGLALSSDESLLISNSFDNSVRVWNVQAVCATESRQFGIYSGAIHHPDANQPQAVQVGSVFSPQTLQRTTPVIIAASYDNSAVVWDLRTKKQITKLAGHSAPVTSLAMNESWVATGSVDKTIIVGPVVI